MAEFEGYTEQEFETDIDIDFSGWSTQQKLKLLEAIMIGNIYTFESTPVTFAGEVTIDVEPMHNEGRD